MINPECLASLLFCETMQRSESIVICGAERFSNYTGYSNSFRWSGDHQDTTPRELPAAATTTAAGKRKAAGAKQHQSAGGRLCTVVGFASFHELIT